MDTWPDPHGPFAIGHEVDRRSQKTNNVASGGQTLFCTGAFLLQAFTVSDNAPTQT